MDGKRRTPPTAGSCQGDRQRRCAATARPWHRTEMSELVSSRSRDATRRAACHLTPGLRGAGTTGQIATWPGPWSGSCERQPIAQKALWAGLSGLSRRWLRRLLGGGSAGRRLAARRRRRQARRRNHRALLLVDLAEDRLGGLLPLGVARPCRRRWPARYAWRRAARRCGMPTPCRPCRLALTAVPARWDQQLRGVGIASGWRSGGGCPSPESASRLPGH